MNHSHDDHASSDHTHSDDHGDQHTGSETSAPVCITCGHTHEEGGACDDCGCGT